MARELMEHTATREEVEKPANPENLLRILKRIAAMTVCSRRDLVRPPGLPEETTVLLRRAFVQAFGRKKLHERAARADLPITYESNETVLEEILRQVEVYKRYQAVLKQRMGLKWQAQAC